MDPLDWCLIESDPAVFTEMIQEFGVKDVEMQEVFDLGSLEALDMHGLVFLFKFDSKTHKSSKIDHSSPVFFAQQVINNACATQAILSILLNRPELEIGEMLERFKEFTMELPPDLRGLAISNSDEIRAIHNSFARSDPFQLEQSNDNDEEKEDAFHFVAYIESKGTLYELDGLQQGPINHGKCLNFATDVSNVIQSRIASFGNTEIRFSLMALTKSRLALLQEQFERIQDDISEAAERQKELILLEIQQESLKREQWTRENQRRRANFLGLTLALLEQMTRKGLINC